MYCQLGIAQPNGHCSTGREPFGTAGHSGTVHGHGHGHGRTLRLCCTCMKAQLDSQGVANQARPLPPGLRVHRAGRRPPISSTANNACSACVRRNQPAAPPDSRRVTLARLRSQHACPDRSTVTSQTAAPPASRWRASCIATATASSCRSQPGAAESCTASGRPAGESPHGTATAGAPHNDHRLAGRGDPVPSARSGATPSTGSDSATWNLPPLSPTPACPLSTHPPPSWPCMIEPGAPRTPQGVHWGG